MVGQVLRDVKLSWTRTRAEITAQLPFTGHVYITLFQQAGQWREGRRDDIVCLDGKDIDIIVETIRQVREAAEAQTAEAQTAEPVAAIS